MTLFKRPPDIPSSEITTERHYFGRRQFIRDAGVLAASALAVPSVLAACTRGAVQDESAGEVQGTDEKVNSYEEITSYNNF